MNEQAIAQHTPKPGEDKGAAVAVANMATERAALRAENSQLRELNDVLLAALKAAYPALENHILPAHDQAVRDRHAQVLQRVEHAIAKAEGRRQ